MIRRSPGAFGKELDHKRLFTFCLNGTSLNQRPFPVCIVRVRSHAALAGPVAEGNHQAGALAVPVLVNQPFERARSSCSLPHRNASGLQKEFHLAKAKAVTRACPDCHSPDPVSLPAEG